MTLYATKKELADSIESKKRLFLEAKNKSMVKADVFARHEYVDVRTLNDWELEYLAGALEHSEYVTFNLGPSISFLNIKIEGAIKKYVLPRDSVGLTKTNATIKLFSNVSEPTRKEAYTKQLFEVNLKSDNSKNNVLDNKYNSIDKKIYS